MGFTKGNLTRFCLYLQGPLLKPCIQTLLIWTPTQQTIQGFKNFWISRFKKISSGTNSST